ncbi:MAG TPA: NAD-dependent epimerase/dehydratase family protein [Candidatus Bathyarchaeia archaeon]|nr:NAD-dependent epimerase/dehydratase family protein [Candidatus Bathyarchaeia archaeon]
MTTIMITGGAGFIGYHLTKYLLEREIKVIIYDNFSDYYSPELKWMNALECEKLGAKIVQGDILDKKQLAKTISEEECERIIHLAAQPGVRYSTINPDVSLRINVEGTSNILTIARECNVSRVVVSSSSSVFGPTVFLPMNEGHPKNPISFYGVSKLTKEQLVSVTRHLYPEFDTVIIRPFTVVGARQRPDMAINKFVSKAMTGETITVFGDGKQTRDWTHVENMAQAFYLAATKPKAKNQIFNIGAGTRISVNSVLRYVSEITNRELNIEYAEMNKADVQDTFADISKAKFLLGYQPIKTIEDAIEDFTEYWLTQYYSKTIEQSSSEAFVSTELSAK